LTIEVTKACQERTDYWEKFLEMDKKINKLIRSQIGHKNNMIQSFEEERNYDPFFNWLSENGVDVKQDLETTFNQDEGHGLKAKKPYKKGDLIVSVPLNLMLTNKTAVETGISLLVAKDEMFQTIQSLPLALHLIIERYKLKSKWNHYINSFPKYHRLPLYWTIQQLEKAKGSSLLIEIIKQRASIARQYAHTWRLLEKFEDNLIKRDSFTYDIFRWAYATIISRKNQIPLIGRSGNPVDILSLIPLYDLFNHEDGDEITAEYSLETESIECRAKRDFEVGEQIYMFYGHRSNMDLMLNSGFCMRNNKWDYNTILFQILDTDRFKERKIKLLEQNNMPPIGLYVIYPTANGENPISEELIKFLRIFVIQNESDLDKAQELITENKPISTENELRLYSLLGIKLMQTLEQYPTTLEEDRELLRNDTIEHYEKHLRRLLISEKEILQNALEFCKNQKDIKTRSKE